MGEDLIARDIHSLIARDIHSGRTFCGRRINIRQTCARHIQHREKFAISPGQMAEGSVIPDD
ncbi:MAG TPA: hypothetical protein PLU88_01045, partial [Armatimonadota bacterium]|nr:hypothetical protein [Armatimonadota bacterium]